MTGSLTKHLVPLLQDIDPSFFFPDHFSHLQVGMQNSSLGLVLASTHFTSPMVALPSAISAVLMNILGSSLGFIWGQTDPPDTSDR